VTLGEFLDNRARRYREGEGDFCSCGERLPSCAFMTELAEKLKAQGLEFSVDYPDTAFRNKREYLDRILRAYVRGPGFEFLRRMAISLIPSVRGAVQQVVSRNMSVISTILEMEGASVYLDSAKNNNRVIFLDRYARDMDVRVIWLIRDGRGVSNSIIGHKDVDMATAARRWATAQQSVLQTVDYLSPQKVFKMKYEDLCAEPHEWLSSACDFLDLDPTQIPEDFSADGMHLTGNSMRLKGLGEIKRDTKWIRNLSPADLEIFDRIGGPLNRKLGYEGVEEAVAGIDL